MKLEWQSNPPEKSMTWYEAMKYAELLGNGWRLPTRSELINACDNKVEGFEDSYYWSSSTFSKNTNLVWCVNFYNENVVNNDKTYSYFVRCVVNNDKTYSYFVRCVRSIKENKKMDKEEMQNKIDQLEKELNELKKITELERWKPYTEGFNIEGDYYGHALPPGFKNERFRTKELAKLRQKQIEAENELFNIWEYLVGNWRPDWSNSREDKWCFYYVEGNNKCDLVYSRNEVPQYRLFPSQKLAQKQYELASDHARSYMRGEF